MRHPRLARRRGCGTGVAGAGAAATRRERRRRAVRRPPWHATCGRADIRGTTLQLLRRFIKISNNRNAFLILICVCRANAILQRGPIALSAVS